jgi:UDP-4-amino-4,6-dideoxy-L-N-acetyl-beta-L-altrosamine transaminase
MRSEIYYGSQFVDDKDIKSVSNSLKEKLITTGKNVIKFENNLKKKLKCNYVISCSNATAGLHLAYMSINIKKNDVILMPAINFISSFSMALKMDAKVYLIDVDPKTGQINSKTIEDCIKKNKLKKIKALVTMYLGGFIFDIEKISQLKKKYNFYIIEDACHALGAKYRSNKQVYNIGSCCHSDISVFSFHPVKSITTGEGGAITTNSKLIFNRIVTLRSHGIVKKKKYWKYDIQTLSHNYRLSDLNCALGISQLKKLNHFILKRKKIFQIYEKEFFEIKNIKLISSNNLRNAYHLAILNINFKILKKKKDQLFKYLNNYNIYPQYHYIPIYKFSFYKKFSKKKYPGAEEYHKNSITLPIHANLSNLQIKFIASKIKSFILKDTSKLFINTK